MMRSAMVDRREEYLQRKRPLIITLVAVSARMIDTLVQQQGDLCEEKTLNSENPYRKVTTKPPRQ
jgi:hypothetical protein